MAYQKKYYFSFKQLHTDDIHTVELWQNTGDVLIAEEVKGLTSPFITEINDLDHKFQPVIGQGCEIGLLSETDRKFFDGLYHVDPKEFIVKHYIGLNINFLGYLNSEMYTESYDSSENYGTSITGHDGLALADRYTFLTSGGSKYTGLKTEWDILLICLNSIGIDWEEIRIALDTTFNGYSGGSDVTILHETYVSCANFYDEDDYPMSMREVMESILQPYGAQLFCQDGHVYIVDIQTRTKGIDDGWLTDPVFKRFDYSTEAYIADISININKSVQELGYSGTGQSIEISGGVNKQVIAYSPYPLKNILDECLIGLDEFGTIPVGWTPHNGYFIKILEDNNYISIFATPDIAHFESSYFQGTVDGNDINDGYDGYLFYTYYAMDDPLPPYGKLYTTAAALTNPIDVNISSKSTTDERQVFDGVSIKLSFDLLVGNNLGNIYRQMHQLSDFWFSGIRLVLKAKIGNLYYDGDTDSWTPNSNNTFNLDFINIESSTWQNFEKIIKIGDISTDEIYSGTLNIYFTTKIQQFKQNAWIDYDIDSGQFTSQPAVWIKNYSIKISNSDLTEIQDSDVEYIGVLNDLFKNEGEKITLTTGTDMYLADRGKLIYNDGSKNYSIKEWTRAGQTYKIEELLLNSLVSNYRYGFIKLNNMRLKEYLTILNVITDDNIQDKVFMLKSAKFDHEMNDVECSLQETSPDRLTIVK